MKGERTTCSRPDRHEPRMTCGYPLPCPWHTLVVDGVAGAVDLVDTLARARRTARRARNRRPVPPISPEGT